MKYLLVLICCLPTLLTSGCSLRVLDPASKTASAQSDLIYFSFFLMLVVLLIVFSLFAHFIRKYRAGNSAHSTYNYPDDNRRLELLWTILPIILLTILAVPTVIVTYQQSPNQYVSTEKQQEDQVHIQVTAERYSWQFRYENGETSTNNLYLPSNQEVVFHLQSNDVIHSFWIPSLGGKVDVLPDQENSLTIADMEEGVYQGKCAEFCGIEHSRMRFTAHVLSAQAFQHWLNQ
ncbi:cytochrome c oxidase subunit II [Radiobacillus sp. PE A8.2]|uniref:cytochrome c oxidase subunit II n=1 Tax=Radiobacillus sp. PE A8.2 TaxID=3380349 RepID=UPI003890045E